MLNNSIVLYGESWRGAMCFSIKRALESKGYTVDIYDFTKTLYAYKCKTLIRRALDKLLFLQIAWQINRDFLQLVKLRKPYLIIVSKGVHLFPETIQKARQYTSCIVNWNPDDFFNNYNSSIFLSNAFKQYDFIFTARKKCISEYYRKGAKNVEFLEFCYDPDIHYPLSINDEERNEWGSEVAFIGTWSRHREMILAELTKVPLKVWGGQWHKAKRTFKNYVKLENRWAYLENYSKVCQASNIMLNILTPENRDETNLRLFEICACKGFLLTERTEQTLSIFSEGKDIACYSSVEELLDKCKYYLVHPQQARIIASRGYDTVVRSNHSYADRMNTILKVCGLK